MPNRRSTGRRCSHCGQTIQQNEKLFTDGQGNYSHGHAQQGWREVKVA